MPPFIQRLFLPFCLCACCLFAAGAAAQAQSLPYISVDLSGRVLAHNRAFDRWYPASLTKMMTAYIAFQALRDGKIKTSAVIKISPEAARTVPSLSGWRPGSALTLDTALTVMMVKSANDMANAIAEAVKGSQEAFVAEMNAQARRLGMTGTHYANPSGLPDPQNYSDARDIAVLAAQLRLDFPQYSHYFSIPAIDFGKGRKPQPNSNYLIGRYKDADGMKTGFICASGFNLVASATRGGRTIIAVVLGAGRIDIREELAAKLLSQGFKTAGSPKLTLANLRPYGDRQTAAANLRSAICNAEAGKLRRQLRDEKGRVVFNSPYIAAPEEPPAAVAVRALFEPPKPQPAARAARKTAAGKAAAGRARAAASKTAADKTTAAAGKTAAAASGMKPPRAKPAGREGFALPPPEAWRAPVPASRAAAAP